jgi:hypothetical protein
MKDNELIAAFMGAKRTGAYYHVNNEIRYQYLIDGYGHVYTNEYAFHAKWDWLMPVVEKIADMMPHINMPDDLEALKNGTHGSEQHIEVLSLPISSKITEVHEAVVKFITWYNSQPSPPSEQKPNEGPIDEYYFIKGPE